MNISTLEIVDQVFDEYIPKLSKLSSHPQEINIELKEMQSRLSTLLYAQYYQNTLRFMRSIDVEDMLSSSPPRTQIIRKIEPNTPLK
jgi:hypothetical protein